MAYTAPAFDAGTRAMGLGGEIAATALEGVRRLADLNMRATREALAGAGDRIRDLLGARDASALTELVAGLARPAPDAFGAYAREAFAISAEIGNALAGVLTRQATESTVHLTEAIAALAANPPSTGAGADPLAFVRQAMRATEEAYDRVNQAANRFVEAVGAPAAEAEAWAEEVIVAAAEGEQASIPVTSGTRAAPRSESPVPSIGPALAARPEKAGKAGSAGGKRTTAGRKPVAPTTGKAAPVAARRKTAKAVARTGAAQTAPLWPGTESTASTKRPAAKRLPRKPRG